MLWKQEFARSGSTWRRWKSGINAVSQARECPLRRVASFPKHRSFDFPNGTLTLTEAGSKRRAALFVIQGDDDLRKQDPGGLDVLEATLENFRAVLQAHNHTLKRILTDPHLFSGIGNAYSDEILHRARLSPFHLSRKLSANDADRLLLATKNVLREWTDRLRHEAGDGFPEKVTAFRPEMAVHGKFGQSCPVCGAPVQRIRYAD